MMCPYTSCPFYLFLTLITTWTDAENVETVKAVHGSSVYLPCASELYANATYTVKWKKNGTHAVLCQYHVVNGTATNVISCKPHISVTGTPPKLYLTGVKTRDAGYYTCSVYKVIPPPTVEKFYKVKLHIEGPPHVIIEQQTSNKSGCLWLLCELDGLDSTEVNLTWSQNGQSIPETTSSLHLCKPDWSEGDTFTCNISQSSNYTGLSANITITQTHSRVDNKANSLIMICVGVFAGTVALICLVICIYKCKKADSRDGSIVYTNKVYENFSFSTTGQQTQRNATPHAHEQCIYEN